MKARVLGTRYLLALAVSLSVPLASGCKRKTEPIEGKQSEVAAERGRTNPNAVPKEERQAPFAKQPASTTEQKAMKAAIWGTPIVSVEAMRRAYFRDAKARYNDVVYWSKPADWKNQTTTPNAASNYVYFNFNLKAGPVVVEVPPAVGAGLFGSILDAWQVPKTDVGPDGADAGKGGKYLLVPPNFQGNLPTGFIPVRFDTYNGYALFRAIPEAPTPVATERTVHLIKELRVHPLAHSNKKEEQRFIDMSGKLFDGIVRFDASFYEHLARMVEEEPLLPRDADMAPLLKGIGIEKGKPFHAPPAEALEKGAANAHQAFINRLPTLGDLQWNDRKWRTPDSKGAKTGFTFESGGVMDVEARGAMFYLAYAPPAKLGKATFYLTATSDRAGQPLDGESSYKLHVPSHVPAKQFWAVTVYNVDSASFVRESPRVEVNSYKAVLNADRSADLYFGPKPPADKSANWVYTEPNERWFAIFRFYGPEAPVFDKSFKLEDLEKTN